MSLSVYTLKDISASQERLCHLLSKNYKSACAICWENIVLHTHPEIEIWFKFIPKILMSKKCIHFFGPLCIWYTVSDEQFICGAKYTIYCIWWAVVLLCQIYNTQYLMNSWSVLPNIEYTVSDEQLICCAKYKIDSIWWAVDLLCQIYNVQYLMSSWSVVPNIKYTVY